MTTKKTVLITSNKGGVGKTTQVRETACALAAAGWQVDVIDMSRQGNLTRRLGVDRAALANAGHPGTADLLDPTRNISYHDTVVPCGWDHLEWARNIRVVPSLDAMAMEYRALEAGRPGAGRRLLTKITGRVDDRHVVLIDLDPAMDHLMEVAITAADGVIICVEPDYDAVEGGLNVSSYVEMYRHGIGRPDLDVLGVSITRARSGLSVTARAQMDNLPNVFSPDRIWQPPVPYYDTLHAAQSDARPLADYTHTSARRLEEVFAAHAALLAKALGH